jgi:hypothetical protein
LALSNPTTAVPMNKVNLKTKQNKTKQKTPSPHGLKTQVKELLDYK